MKKAYIVTSVIEPNNHYSLTYSTVRSLFTAEERLRQTIATIVCLDHISDIETTIYLVDASKDWSKYVWNFSHQKNLKFISLEHDDAVTAEHVRTHPNKSHGECTMLSWFMTQYEEELKTFDYITKISGRYLFDHSVDVSIFNAYNRDKIFYKQYLEFAWQDSWGYELVDLRKQQGDNCLRQYPSIMFGWGQNHTPLYKDLFDLMAKKLAEPMMQHYDVETLGYYYTRPYVNYITQVPWTVYGWYGPNGKFVRF